MLIKNRISQKIYGKLRDIHSNLRDIQRVTGWAATSSQSPSYFLEIAVEVSMRVFFRCNSNSPLNLRPFNKTRFVANMISQNIWRSLPVVLTAVVITACHGVKQKEFQEFTESYTSKKVFILLVNPHSQHEGIYTISNKNQEQVVMFENQEDAIRYNKLLAKQHFPGLVVEEISKREVDEFCKVQHYECKLLIKGTHAVPPRKNVETSFLPKRNNG